MLIRAAVIERTALRGLDARGQIVSWLFGVKERRLCVLGSSEPGALVWSMNPPTGAKRGPELECKDLRISALDRGFDVASKRSLIRSGGLP